VSLDRVYKMIWDGTLPAERGGDRWSITEEAVKARLRRTPARRNRDPRPAPSTTYSDRIAALHKKTEHLAS